MNVRKAKLLLPLLLSFLTACVVAPQDKYANSEKNISKTDKDTRSFKVQANKAWQQPGIYLPKGATVSLRANGSWSPWPLIGMTCDANGDPSSTLTGEVPWIPICALMAKIGFNGRPFLVGYETEFVVEQGGQLFLSINDPFAYLADNTGDLTVSASIKYPAGNSSISSPDRSNIAATLSPQVKTAVQAQQTTIEPKNTSLSSSSQPRIALVVGNASYLQAPLDNPANDASDMASTLQNLGFKVISAIDVNQQQLEESINRFGRQLTPQSVALFYYAGHAIQVNGENYLVPINSGIQKQSDVRFKAVNVGMVLEEMGQAENSLNIVILDACRNNPLPRSFRSSSRGLAKIDGPTGTLIAYATSPGSVASDGEGRNGIYTKHLLKNITTSGLPVEQVFKKVLQGVKQDTNSGQVPWLSSSFSGDFYFTP